MPYKLPRKIAPKGQSLGCRHALSGVKFGCFDSNASQKAEGKGRKPPPGETSFTV